MGTIKKAKVRFISDDKCIYLKKGAIYNAFRPLDDRFGKWWGIYIAEDDDPGDYAFPSEWFEVLGETDEEYILVDERPND